MTQDVSITKPQGSDQFPAATLRQFLAAVDQVGLPDHTVVRCYAREGGNLFSISTSQDLTSLWTNGEPVELGSPDPAPTDQAERSQAGLDGVELIQNTTGPLVRRRRWWNRRPRTHHLLVRDVRTLLARADELGLPDDRYVVTVLKAPETNADIFHIRLQPARARKAAGGSKTG